MNLGDSLVCSFCTKTRAGQLKFVAGPDGTYICSECVALCNEIIDGQTGTDPTPALGRLGASWRGDYIMKATAEEDADATTGSGAGDEARCVFCRILRSGGNGRSDEQNLIVYRGTDGVVILNA